MKSIKEYLQIFRNIQKVALPDRLPARLAAYTFWRVSVAVAADAAAGCCCSCCRCCCCRCCCGHLSNSDSLYLRLSKWTRFESPNGEQVTAGAPQIVGEDIVLGPNGTEVLVK